MSKHAAAMVKWNVFRPSEPSALARSESTVVLRKVTVLFLLLLLPLSQHLGCARYFGQIPSALSCATVCGCAAWPSVLMTCGAGWFAPPSA